MSPRPLVFVFGLTVGDYLLWSWSLGGNHDVLALVSGLTLPPLAVACLWLVALGSARLIGRTARRSHGRTARGSTRSARTHRRSSATPTAATPPAPASASSDAPSRKLAA